MDEIEYKLNTNNNVLVVNAIDKLISTIKLKFKPAERQKFVLENEELKFLREKCSSKEALVSLTACQGLLALVELGVLEIGHTMSTVVTLLPSAHNYSAIISTMAGLLVLDLKSRLIPGQPYKCQFKLKSPQHPFITVLEKNKGAEDDVLAQIHALCSHPDYIVSSNSLELLRPVFLYLTCNPQRDGSIRPWQLLLSLPETAAQSSLLLDCLSCQQICSPNLIERAFSAYSAVADTAIYRQQTECLVALVPMLVRISNELVKHGRDPRACYILISRCFSVEIPQLRSLAGVTLMLLAENLSHTSALYLHELFNLCLNIINKYECSEISLNAFVALSLQWLHLPSYLTSSALKVAAKILDIYRDSPTDDTRLHMPNLKANKIFQTLLYTDSHLSIIIKLNSIWERLRDDTTELKSWLDSIETVDDSLKFEILPFLIGVMMVKSKDPAFEEIVLKVLKIVVGLVEARKEVSVELMPILVYKIANDVSPNVKMECLKALPLMAKTKENVPIIVSVLNKLKANKGIPTSFLITLYTSLAETQVRCFPYLQEMLVDPGAGRPDDLKWEVDIAKALAVKRICEIRASTHGLEVVGVISSVLNRCGDKAGSAATCLALRSLELLWRAAAVAPPGAWRALETRLARDTRPRVLISMCLLLSAVPELRAPSAEYTELVRQAAARLWRLVPEGPGDVIEAACDALAEYNIQDYRLKDVPEIYRKTVKLPASYCKTPADAARKPEDVLDYIPCEVWPEVFKYTNQAALPAVVRWLRKLCEREIKSYRSGVYHVEGKGEPLAVSLPAASPVKGLLECLRRQATSPSYDYPDAVLLSILEVLTAAYLKPLPPLDLSFLHEMFHRGTAWKRECVTLSVRQMKVSPSAKRLLDNFLQGVADGSTDETDILLVFELLPTLCRTMPPNSLRPPIERALSEAFHHISGIRAKDSKDPSDHLFIKLLDLINKALDCEDIHDANRTLLAQLVENYFSVISDDNVAWGAYVETSRRLPGKHVERMTSPSGWWEVSAALLRKATRVRCAVARAREGRTPLVWLNELVDAQAAQLTDQEYSLCCMLPALKAASPDDVSTRDWFLQLMARTQVAFTETEDESAKLYLCDVFMLSLIVFSGLWPLAAAPHPPRTRTALHPLLPAAAHALVAKPLWTGCTAQLVEWVSHTRDAARDAATAQCCQRALLSLRHTQHFHTHNIWIRLESHFSKDIVEESNN